MAPLCNLCNEHKINMGIPGFDYYVCINGCEDLTKVLPVINPEELSNAKRTE